MEVPEIDVAELADKRASGALVIDVREPDEYAGGHVPGAQLIPLAMVPDRLEDIPSDGTVYVICKSGGRSRQASEFLLAQGRDVANVAGGTDAWVASGQPIAAGTEPG